MIRKHYWIWLTSVSVAGFLLYFVLMYLNQSVFESWHKIYSMSLINSGKRWAVMMKTWTPSGRTKSVMFSTPIRTTGYGQNTSGVAVRSESTWRWSSLLGTAVAFLMFQAPVKRLLTYITMNLILIQPPEHHHRGWRTPGSRLTPLQQMRASPRSTLGAEWWRLTLRFEALAQCHGMAFTWPSKIMAAACLSSLFVSSTGSVLV